MKYIYGYSEDGVATGAVNITELICGGRRDVFKNWRW